ncbi:hypothetical protein BC937DRAFT_91863 [Endogone sp. FLAS-F59071]|nr:hypothetical protein BC937DRAFT_91863 [Endogone sp. FLAS-F59071]|eukprot:RUS15880.1 hypothetical protein BC937DRAFT_91863 [Endogone sp. FLAS-F59071]
MFHPHSLLLLLVLVLSAVTVVHSSLDPTTGLAANCSDPAYQSCAFYLQCAEARYQCGPNGYPVSYGNRYCTKFEMDQGELSEAGKKWMWNVMKCLEDTLVPTVTAEKQVSCNQLSRRAFDSHPYCYVRSGLCALPLSDLVAILNIIGLSALIHIEMFKVAGSAQPIN